MSFFHGIKTVAVQSKSTTVNTVPSCIIGLVGVSPFGPTQALTICNNDTDDAQFGIATPDNNIAKTLALIREVVKGASVEPSDGSCAVIVVNVYSNTHRSALSVTATPDATTGICSIAKTLVGDPSAIKIKQSSTPVNVAAGGAYIYGTDYTLDGYGNFVDITGTYKNVVLTFGDTGNYYLNVSAVTGSHIVGGNSSGTRTGRALLDLCRTKWGFVPKILITPTYCGLTGVQADFEAAATSYRGIFLSDAPAGTSYAAALALRGSGQWATQKPATRPLFPMLGSADAATNSIVNYPFSAFLAGMYVANDMNVGPWQSVSNQQIPGVEDVELKLTTGYSDPNSEANALNAQGIMTYNSEYGTGFLTWGNRNASFPANSTVNTFDNVYRMDCIVSDTMEQAFRPNVDRNITKAEIDIMLVAGNNLINLLIEKGAVLPGSEVTYDKTKNSGANIAAGKLKITRRYMIYTPAEDIEIENILDIDLFNNLNK